MVIDRPWKALVLPESYPPLWLKARLDSRHAAIELTDLNRIWGMQMSKPELVRDARDQSCSIDPGEDSEQYDQFLSKVESALNGQKRTTLNLRPGDAQDWISLDVSAPLPGSLPTFRWRIELRPRNEPGSTAIESQLLTPFLLYTSHLRLQMQQLVEELGQKDRVIAKITDKLETTGNDLTQVFPGVSNVKTHRKTSQRSQLASHIRGLADFDEKAWKDQTIKVVDTDLPADEIDQILAELPQPGPTSKRKDNSGAWYRDGEVTEPNGKAQTEAHAPIDGDLVRREGTQKGKPKFLAEINTHGDEKEEEDDDDEFQRQATPPKDTRPDESASAEQEIEFAAGSNGIETSAMDNADLSTEDEDDLDAPSQRSSKNNTASQLALESSQTISHRSQAEPASGKPAQKQKLGTIGGRRAKTPEPKPEVETDDGVDKPAAHTRSNTSHEALRGKSKSKSKSATPPTSPAAALETAQDSPPKRRGKLGTFGVSKKSGSPAPQEADPDPEPLESPAKTARAKLGAFGGNSKRKASPVPEDENDQGQAIASPRKGKLGTFGGSKAENEAPPSHSAEAQETEDRQSRAPVKEEHVEQPSRETSEERANRQRDKLKTQIEDQSKAPAKKKSRF